MQFRRMIVLGGSVLTMVCLSGLFLSAVFAANLTLYVDPQIPPGPCIKYNPSTRNCETGTATAYATIAAASAVATPGTTVLIRGGTYSEALIPQTSGDSGQYITFKNYESEPVFLGGETGIVLSHRRYIWIEGLHVEDRFWLEANNSDAEFARNFQNRSFNVIKSCIFKRTPASGTTGNIRIVRSHDNRLLDNTIEDGRDNIVLVDSDRNVVQGNRVAKGRHSLISVRCSDYNVIRDNYFVNPLQKIGEVYDCGKDTSAVPHAFDATKHNLFENNVFAEASEYYNSTGGNGIQYAGQEGIIRRNVFFNGNVGMSFATYGDESLYNVNNRTYHNVFYNNDGAGISLGAGEVNNRFKNNILFANKGCTPECSATTPGQILYEIDPNARPFWETSTFYYNAIFYQQPGQAVIEQSESSGPGLSIADFNYEIAKVFLNSLEVNPQFVNAAAGDFHLQSGSPLIDAGDFLTKTTEAKTESIIMQVQDAAYFYDGYGIAGEQGDLVQLQGGTTTARIVSVNYGTNTLTLDRPLSWTAGQGVTLQFGGSAPDVGAFETNLSTAIPPPPAPTNLRATQQ